jgi:hypothetical protein
MLGFNWSHSSSKPRIRQMENKFLQARDQDSSKKKRTVLSDQRETIVPQETETPHSMGFRVTQMPESSQGPHPIAQGPPLF